MSPVDPVNTCFLTPYDWKRQHKSALQKSTSIIPVDATHPQNFPQCQRRMAQPCSRCLLTGVPRGYGLAVHVIYSCPSESASSVMEQFTKMNIRSAHIKRDYLCSKSLRRVSFQWRSTVLFCFLLSRLSIDYIIPALFIFLSIFFCFFGSTSVSSGCAKIHGARIYTHNKYKALHGAWN